jgi:D-glycero-D-manno-heptose 1,7-bisphosphate phosphatase
MTDVQRAIFLDRDGVINENRPDHVKSLEEFAILPGVLDALRLLGSAGLPIIVVSNQSAINRGLVSWDTVDAVTRLLQERVISAGGRLDAVFYCPHRPEEKCACRKPRPGLLLQAANELGIVLTGSYFVGDALSDVQAAMAAGAQPLVVLTGRGREQAALVEKTISAHVPICKDLMEAAHWILSHEASHTVTPLSSAAQPSRRIPPQGNR